MLLGRMLAVWRASRSGTSSRIILRQACVAGHGLVLGDPITKAPSRPDQYCLENTGTSDENVCLSKGTPRC